MKPEEHLSAKNKDQKKVCEELKTKNGPAIQEGIDSLNKAIQLRPDYDDAMAYMNLMYRERADVECDDEAARAEDLKTADHWVDETLRVKKAKAEKAAQSQGGGSPWISRNSFEPFRIKPPAFEREAFLLCGGSPVLTACCRGEFRLWRIPNCCILGNDLRQSLRQHRPWSDRVFPPARCSSA